MRWMSGTIPELSIHKKNPDFEFGFGTDRHPPLLSHLDARPAGFIPPFPSTDEGVRSSSPPFLVFLFPSSKTGKEGRNKWKTKEAQLQA